MEMSHEANTVRWIAEEIGLTNSLSGLRPSSLDVDAVVDRAIARLDELTITPEEREPIQRRLLTAQRFLRGGEIGAAVFELSMLARYSHAPRE